MDTLIISPLNETYGIENFSETTREILRETDSLFNILYLQENYADQIFLTEAVENNKNILIKGLEKLIEAIKILGQKFITLATRLVTQNKGWLDKAKAANISETVSEKFSLDIFPYWKMESKLRNYPFPEFKETPEFIQELGNLDEFRQKYFKDLHVTTDGKTEFQPKEVFQGGHTQIKMDKKVFLEQYSNMIKYIETYDDLSKSINTRNTKIMEFLKNSVNKIRTTTFRESNELLTTINTLLEQDGPTTSSNIDDKQDPKSQDPNKPDKREEGKDPDKVSKDLVKARESYNRLVYSINSARMGVAEACYNAYAKAIHLGINTNQKATSEKPQDNTKTNK
jgi:hypothetical protein